MNKPLRGSCLCGKVGIEISEPALMTMACHCRGCQKLTSSAFSLCVSIPTTGFRATGIEPVVGALHGDTRHLYCPYCKNWLYSLPAGVESYVNVHPTSFDNIEWLSPFVEVHIAEKLAWATTPAMHSFKVFPDPKTFRQLVEEFQATASSINADSI
ncbi:GFA family protein [Rhizobium leguminosarum]|nr:GFA family protein [Rhizobium leguminosarum]